MSVLDLENSGKLDSDTADKLKVCRILRNYLVHHEDGVAFLEKGKTSFLIQITKEMMLPQKKAKEIMEKGKSVLPSASLFSVASALYRSSSGRLVLVDEDKKPLGILTKDLCLKRIAGQRQASAPIERPRGLGKFFTVSGDDSAKEVMGKIREEKIPAIVLSKNGKYQGVIWEDGT